MIHIRNKQQYTAINLNGHNTMEQKDGPTPIRSDEGERDDADKHGSNLALHGTDGTESNLGQRVDTDSANDESTGSNKNQKKSRISAAQIEKLKRIARFPPTRVKGIRALGVVLFYSGKPECVNEETLQSLEFEVRTLIDQINLPLTKTGYRSVIFNVAEVERRMNEYRIAA